MSPSAIEARLGRPFADAARLTEALTHSTYVNEHPGEGPDNERLEFLGDAVLDLIVSELLYGLPGAAPEGEMSRRRARVVRQSALARMARDLELGDALRLGAGQKKTGGNESIHANAYEALVGAVYLDGGLDGAKACFGAALAAAVSEANNPLDFKTRLQELCHQRGWATPSYRVVDTGGPDHARWFVCEVAVAGGGESGAGEVVGTGRGSSKKAAEQKCAEIAAERLEGSAEGTGDHGV